MPMAIALARTATAVTKATKKCRQLFFENSFNRAPNVITKSILDRVIPHISG